MMDPAKGVVCNVGRALEKTAEQKDYFKMVFGNGLRLIAVPQKGSLTVTVLVMVEAGSKYEAKCVNGISHFLEHMCFKGTEKRPKAMDIASALDSIGADYNAFTAEEYTGFYVKCQAEKIDTAIDVLSDIYLNPIFDEKEIRKEKGVIIEEMNAYEDAPEESVAELFTKLLYGDQPAGWGVLGTKESVRLLTRADLTRYRCRHYLAGTTTVVVVGAFDLSVVVEKVRLAFEDMFAGAGDEKLPVRESQNSPRILVKQKNTEQIHLTLGCRVAMAHIYRGVELRVLSAVLGGGTSSRLWQKIREGLGAAYYVNSYVDSYTDHGFFSVSCGVKNDKLEKVVQVILDELREMACNKVLEEELERVKNFMAGSIVLGLEATNDLAEYYGKQEIRHWDILTPGEYLKRIQAVTSRDILEVAKDIFNKDDGLNLAIIGSVSRDAKARLKKILKF